MKVDTIRAEVDDYRMAARKGDPQAKVMGQKLLASRTNSPALLCEFAYRIVTDTGNTNRDFALAEQAIAMAEKAGPTNAARFPISAQICACPS